MSNRLELVKKEYAVSDIRLINLILNNIGGIAKIELTAVDGYRYTFDVEMNHNITREILIILEGLYRGFKEIGIKNEDGDVLNLKIGNEIVECTANNKIIDKVVEVLELLKGCDNKGMTRVIQLGYDNISITNMLDISKDLGSLLDAETVQIEGSSKNSQIHIIKYKEFSLGVYNNIVYLIDFGLYEGSMHNTALKINKHLSDGNNIEYSLEEYFIR